LYVEIVTTINNIVINHHHYHYTYKHCVSPSVLASLTSYSRRRVKLKVNNINHY